MTGYINKIEKNKVTILFWLKINNFWKIKKNMEKKIKRLMGIDFESKATYDDKYINTKLKAYKDSITTNFYDKTGFKELPEEKVPHKFLSIIILDSVLYAYKKYYPQTLLEECKYMRENVKPKNYIDMELESRSDTDTDTDSGIYIEE